MSDLAHHDFKYDLREDTLIEIESPIDELDVYYYDIFLTSFRFVVHTRIYFKLDDIQKIECKLDPNYLLDLVNNKIKKHLPDDSKKFSCNAEIIYRSKCIHSIFVK